MVNTKKNNAPFGSGCPRFDKITSHPNLDPSGLYIQRPLGCDPCRYHPQPIHLIFEVNRHRKVDKDPWRYKSELEQWSKNLGYRNQKILAEREWRSTLLGPAWTSVPVPPLKKYEPACKNVGFGRTPRFKSSRNDFPGPGTYYNAVPYKALYGPHSTRPTLEREEPCRFKNTTTNWSLAPNRYEIIDKDSIEMKSKRIVSKRGPYDLFTGKRDGSTIKNHFSSKRCSATSWPLALPGSLEKLKNSPYGKMNKTGQDAPHRGRLVITDLAMCIKRPEDPSPASYNVEKPRDEWKQNKYGFNSSYDRAPGYRRVIVWPGVGRYTVKRLSCGIAGKGHRHVFLSKIGRTIGAKLPEPMNSF